MIWLGAKRGYLNDWITQRWVEHTGRRIVLQETTWLDGPTAPTSGIGEAFFEDWALTQGLEIEKGGRSAGILPDFSALRGRTLVPSEVDANVADFYEQTAAYELDAWAEWRGFFRPFGWLLAVIFSRRLQQLNVPLSGLDTSRGMTNDILLFRNRSGDLCQTAWFRRLHGSGNILYAGFYSICRVPGHPDPCVKVVFPLPNGNAIVIMHAECQPDRSFRITSSGNEFGEPGFYFTVNAAPGFVWARYVRAMRESIRVYSAENETVRADHSLHLWGITFLNLHYRMRKSTAPAPKQSAAA
jgi:hypothetical protein